MTQDQIDALNALAKAVQAGAKAFSDTLLAYQPSAPVSSTQPQGGVVQPIRPKGGEARTDLQLVWDEQFSDLSNWRKGSRDKASGYQASPGYPNAEAEFYTPTHSTLLNGKLFLFAEKRYVKVIKVTEGASNQNKFELHAGTAADPDIFYWPYYEGVLPWQSGWVMTGPDDYGWSSTPQWQAQPALKEFTYGWIEASIKLPKGQGLWPAFWMLRSDKANGQEIDILEMIDPNCRKAELTYHKADGSGDTTEFDTGVDLSLDYHTFAVDWRADYIKWYVDGRLCKTVIDKSIISNTPMYLILNLAVGAQGSWPGVPYNTLLSATMSVDYVRVWK